jgi:hypothetical protein
MCDVPKGHVVDDPMKYAPIKAVASGTAMTSDGARKDVSVFKFIGPVQSTPYTQKELYTFLPTPLKGLLKDLYQEALDLDVSQ